MTAQPEVVPLRGGLVAIYIMRGGQDAPPARKRAPSTREDRIARGADRSRARR